MAKLLWGLAFGPAATAFLNAMPPGKVRAQIVKKAKTLQGDPYRPGCKKLVNVKDVSDDVWRIRSGD